MEDVKAGKPHIILISQLNKQNELKGARELEHLADMVANVTRIPSRKGWFLFNVERKNRGNDTPRHQEFCHTESSVVAVAPRERSEMLYQLRAGVTSAMNAGIEDPAIEMDEEESEE
jgi:predicted ATP-dependent serine protease